MDPIEAGWENAESFSLMLFLLSSGGLLNTEINRRISKEAEFSEKMSEI
jgi:hypothetical protein